MTTPPTPPPPGSSATPQPGPRPGFEQVILPPAPQASFQAAGYPPAPSQVYGQPVRPKSSNTVLKIVLIVLGIFLLLGLLTAAVIGFGAYKLSKAVHRDGNGGLSLSTPAGDISTGSGSDITGEDLAMPIYPGAQRGQGSLKLKTAEGSMVTATYTTGDPIAKVVSFYKEKLGDDATFMQSESNTVITTGDKSRDKRVVTITPEDGTTRILMMHTTGSNP